MEFLLAPRLSPEAQNIQNYFRSTEAESLERLRTIAHAIGQGKGYGVILNDFDKPQTNRFTARGLCVLSAKIDEEKLHKNFPEVKTQLVKAKVLPRDTTNYSGSIEHCFLRMGLVDGTRLSSDRTYGQIHPWLRTLLCTTEEESAYYGERLRVMPYKERKTSDQIIEDMLGRAQSSRGLVYAY